MPIYEYRCTECHQIFEKWIKHVDEDGGIECPVCDSPAERIMSNTSFVLKGGGWYATEYGNRKETGEAASSTDTSAPAPSAGTSDAAPAAAAQSAADSAAVTPAASSAPTPAPSSGACTV